MLPPNVFPVASSPLEIYRSIWGEDPSSFQKSPHPLGIGMSQGDLGDLRVVCTTGLARIDLNFGPLRRPEIEEAPTSFQLIEEAEQLHQAFAQVIKAIRQERLSIKASRLAIATQFASIEEDVRSANQALTATIPDQYGVKLADEDDVIFQVNNPFESKQLAPTKLNLIQNWSVVRFQVVSVAVPTPIGNVGDQMGTVPVTEVGQQIGASVSFEVNNPPGSQVLSIPQQCELLNEGLERIGARQRELGLSVKGFVNAN